MNTGYIMLPRSFFEDDIWTTRRNYTFVEAYLWLLKEAAWKDKYVLLLGSESFEVKKGEVIVSARSLSQEWGWSTNKVLRFFSNLEKTNKIGNRVVIQGRFTRFAIFDMCDKVERDANASCNHDDDFLNQKRNAYFTEIESIPQTHGTVTEQLRNGRGTVTERSRNGDGTVAEQHIIGNQEINKERKKEGKKEEGAPAQKLEPMTPDEIEDLQGRIGHSAAQMWVTGHREQCKTPLHAEQVLRWAAHKFEIKKPILGFSEFSALIKIFNAAPIAKATSVVDYSIANGYAGLFWDRGDPPGENKRKPDDHIAQIIDPKSYEKYANIDPQSYSWDAFLNAGKEPGTDG